VGLDVGRLTRINGTGSAIGVGGVALRLNNCSKSPAANRTKTEPLGCTGLFENTVCPNALLASTPLIAKETITEPVDVPSTLKSTLYKPATLTTNPLLAGSGVTPEDGSGVFNGITASGATDAVLVVNIPPEANGNGPGGPYKCQYCDKKYTRTCGPCGP
jgi:hypothetical protein